MNWEQHKQNLKDGKTVQFRPKGNSMQPRIESGNLVTVSPIEDFKKIEKGDIVLCKVKGTHYVHLVSAVQKKGNSFQFQISNNKNHVNGWIFEDNVFGKVTAVAE